VDQWGEVGALHCGEVCFADDGGAEGGDAFLEAGEEVEDLDLFGEAQPGDVGVGEFLHGTVEVLRELGCLRRFHLSSTAVGTDRNACRNGWMGTFRRSVIQSLPPFVRVDFFSS